MCYKNLIIKKYFKKGKRRRRKYYKLYTYGKTINQRRLFNRNLFFCIDHNISNEFILN